MNEWVTLEKYPNYELSRRGQIRNKSTEHALTPAFSQGYPHVTLIDFEGNRRNVRLHRILAETFIPNPEGKPYVLHGDGNPRNIDLDNLRWGDAGDNAQDALKHGTHSMASKTTCPKGHPYTHRDYRGNRMCGDCLRGRDWTLEHGLSASYQRGCRCGDCKEAAKRVRYSRPVLHNDPRHGTNAGYIAGCRCTDCRKGHNEYAKSYRIKTTGKM